MIDKLKTQRMNKLEFMASQRDQCERQGFDYVPDEKDLALIDKLDSEIVELGKAEGI